MTDTATETATETAQAAKEAAAPPYISLREALSLMAALSGSPDDLVVRIGPVGEKHARVEFSSSGSRDCPLADMHWRVRGRFSFDGIEDMKLAPTVPANYLLAALPDDPSAKVTFAISKEDRAVTIRHSGGTSTLPLMHTKPKVVETDEKVKVQKLPMAMLSQVLARFPARFSLASAIKDDSLVSNLFVDSTDDIIAGFATNSSAVFTCVKQDDVDDADGSLSGQIDINLIEVLRRLPKDNFPNKVLLSDHAITLSYEGRWSITIRRKAASQVAKAADIIAQVKEVTKGAKVDHTYSLTVAELEGALKKASTFAAGATDVTLTGDGQTVVMASGPEARMRTRINLVAKKRKSGFSPITVHGPSLRQALAAFKDDDSVLVTATKGGRVLLLTSRFASHDKGFGNMAMLLAVQTGGK